MSSQRTEAATPKRRSEARRRGNVARSQDLSSGVSLLVGVLVGALTLPRTLPSFTDYLSRTLGSLGEIASDPAGFQATFAHGALTGAAMIIPMVAAGAASGIVATVTQTGGLLTLKPLEPQIDRLNPLRGLQRLFSLRSVVETVKSVAKIAVVVLVAVGAIRSALPTLAGAAGQAPGPILTLLGATAYGVLIRGAFVLLALGVLDYFYQRFEWERGLRMTKEEVRQDLRESEGDPMIRARQRGRQRELARRRMMDDVPRATVVVTNPTSIAVALRYIPSKMAAPTVVAKGSRLVAERIRAIAARHGVPIVENRPLAQALLRTVPLGRQIPPALYHAIAEVLAAIYRVARHKGVHA